MLVTAGPTYEKIDPVRFVGNYSSGKMGFAIAEECARRGADVTIVAGPVSVKCNNPKVKRIDVESAREMYEAAMEEFPSCDVAVLSAAVADYRPAVQAGEKIHRRRRETQALPSAPRRANQPWNAPQYTRARPQLVRASGTSRQALRPRAS